jgi:hypothetical protein
MGPVGLESNAMMNVFFEGLSTENVHFLLEKSATLCPPLSHFTARR